MFLRSSFFETRLLVAVLSTFLIVSTVGLRGTPKEKHELFARPENMICSESESLAACDVMCMCQIMVNRQIYLWDKMFPTSLENAKSKSLCQDWRDETKTSTPITMQCYEHCVIAEQYVLASHGWDPKVCARADQESKALYADAALKERKAKLKGT